MARSEHQADGLQHLNASLASPGYTLFSTHLGPVLIDMHGRVVHRWAAEGLWNVSLQPDGNLLALISSDAKLQGQRGLNGLSAGLVELDWEGNEVWRYDDEWVHHDFEPTPQGTFVMLKWKPMPRSVVRRVKGGYHADDDDPKEMLGDVVIEVDRTGKVLREWRSWDHFDFGEDVICPLDHRKEWSHGNSISLSPKGNWLISFRRIDLVAEVNPKSGEFVWKAHSITSHQHDAKYTSDSTIMIFDNGAHKRGLEHSRVVEVDAKTREEVWSYAQNPPFSFFTFMSGGADPLPNGNVLICESSKGQIFEVTRDGKVVWDYIIPFWDTNPRLGGRMNMSFRAHRYGPDYPGLSDKDLDPSLHRNLNRLYSDR